MNSVEFMNFFFHFQFVRRIAFLQTEIVCQNIRQTL